MKSVLLLLLSAMYSKDTVTDFVNTVEPLLAANRDNYLSLENPTRPQQQAALFYFDQQWVWLQSPQACGSRALGAAGVACLADRSKKADRPPSIKSRDSIGTREH